MSQNAELIEANSQPNVSTSNGRGVANTSVLSIIERAATDPNVDMDKMERLLAMQERITEREAEREFTQAFADAKAAMAPVIRNKSNSTTNSTYADLEIISLAVDPVIIEHGLTLSFGTAESPVEGHYRITATLSHLGGHSKDYHADIPADGTGMKGTKNKTDTHAFGSTMSYGRRYLKCLIFDIALTDDDGNAAGAGACITQDMVATLQESLDETQSDITAFCKLMKIPSLAQMPLAKYPRAEQLLKQKSQQMEGEANG